MRGKALFFGVLVVIGAVLPYLLADPKFSGKMSDLLSRAPETTEQQPERSNIAPDVAAPPTRSIDPIVTVASTPTPEIAEAPIGNLLPNASTYGSPTYGEYGPPNGSLTQAYKVPNPNGALPLGGQFGSAYGTLPTGISTNAPTPANLKSQSPASGLVGPRGIPIEHLLSFDVTPRWISENWSRVTTSLPELELKGWRIPIALQDAYDIIGSVTYYFDRQERAQRILLHGLTKNPQQLAQLATARYQMQRIPNHVGEVYVHMNGGRPLGGLRVSNSSIRKANARCEVLMELNRQGTSYGISREFEKLLRTFYERDATLDPMEEMSFDSIRSSGQPLSQRKTNNESDRVFERRLEALQQSATNASSRSRASSVNGLNGLPNFRSSRNYVGGSSYRDEQSIFSQTERRATRPGNPVANGVWSATGNAIRPPFRRLPK